MIDGNILLVQQICVFMLVMLIIQSLAVLTMHGQLVMFDVYIIYIYYMHNISYWASRHTFNFCPRIYRLQNFATIWHLNVHFI